MFWEVLGALIIFGWMLIGWTWAVDRHGRQCGREQLRQEMAENRALRRAEAREALLGPHRLAPFPDLETRAADTGELAVLTAAAETGDLAEIGRLNAAFWRRLDLKRWVRAS